MIYAHPILDSLLYPITYAVPQVDSAQYLQLQIWKRLCAYVSIQG
jgi:hypothetical protein